MKGFVNSFGSILLLSTSPIIVTITPITNRMIGIINPPEENIKFITRLDTPAKIIYKPHLNTLCNLDT